MQRRLRPFQATNPAKCPHHQGLPNRWQTGRWPEHEVGEVRPFFPLVIHKQNALRGRAHVRCQLSLERFILSEIGDGYAKRIDRYKFIRDTGLEDKDEIGRVESTLQFTVVGG
jgi:hypothetical protein